LVTLSLPVPVPVDILSAQVPAPECDLTRLREPTSDREDDRGGTTPTLTSGVLLVLAGMMGVSPTRLARGVLLDRVLGVGVVVSNAGGVDLIPNSFLALFLKAVVGRAIASLCLFTNSAIDTISCFGFIGTASTLTGLDIGPCSISRSNSLRPDNLRSLAKYLFSLSARSWAIIIRPRSADDMLSSSSSDSVVPCGEWTEADNASDVRLIRVARRCELRLEDQELCFEVVSSSNGSSNASVSARHQRTSKDKTIQVG
jgi:hypothetical protein